MKILRWFPSSHPEIETDCRWHCKLLSRSMHHPVARMSRGVFRMDPYYVLARPRMLGPEPTGWPVVEERQDVVAAAPQGAAELGDLVEPGWDGAAD